MDKQQKKDDNKLDDAAEKLADTILPHYMDTRQKIVVKASLVEFAKAIIEQVKKDHLENYWP